ncbi:MAG: hypothetical protein ACO3OJ_04560, partial [Paracoccaceae bacterium]
LFADNIQPQKTTVWMIDLCFQRHQGNLFSFFVFDVPLTSHLLEAACLWQKIKNFLFGKLAQLALAQMRDHA